MGRCSTFQAHVVNGDDDGDNADDASAVMVECWEHSGSNNNGESIIVELDSISYPPTYSGMPSLLSYKRVLLIGDEE